MLTNRRQRSPQILAVFIAMLFVLASCASPADEPTPTPDPAATPDPATTPDPGDDNGPPVDEVDEDGVPVPWPSAEGDLPEVRMAQSVPALAFAPLQVALHMNFFEYQGVAVDFIELEGGATARQALIGGSVDLVDSASTEVLAAVAAGVDYIVTQGTINQTLELCARADWIEERGVTPDSPLEDRLAALDGATLGITGPGAVSDRGLRWLLIKYGGLDPDHDTVITQIGAGATMAAALEQDQVQGFLLSPPVCEVTGGEGVVLVPPGDVPEFADYIHEVLFAMRPWAEANEDLVRKVSTAISMGNNYIIQYPERSLRILQTGPFSHVDPDVIEAAFYRVVLPQVEALPDGVMTEEQWEATNTVLLEAGVIDEPIDVSEGTFWTNEYIDIDAAQIP
jgi:NitT/TauT family transport system substrate-binding protein